jgi:hypothetical protein
MGCINISNGRGVVKKTNAVMLAGAEARRVPSTSSAGTLPSPVPSIEGYVRGRSMVRVP